MSEEQSLLIQPEAPPLVVGKQVRGALDVLVRHAQQIFNGGDLVITHIAGRVIASAFCEAISCAEWDCFVAKDAPRSDQPDLWIITKGDLQPRHAVPTGSDHQPAWSAGCATAAWRSSRVMGSGRGDLAPPAYQATAKLSCRLPTLAR
jgi:hypothetical protein